AWNLVDAQLSNRALHLLMGANRRGFEIDLVALNRPTGKIAGIVRNQPCSRKRLDTSERLWFDTGRRRHQIVVKGMTQFSRRRRPAHGAMTILSAAGVVVLA